MCDAIDPKVRSLASKATSGPGGCWLAKSATDRGMSNPNKRIIG